MYLSGYLDPSCGNCIDTRRSFSGYLFKLGSATIAWRCRKQQSVGCYTCEAEYMALAFATKQYIWTRSALQQLLGSEVAAALFADGRSAIDLASNPKFCDASKHIDIAYHFTHERLEDGSLSLLHVPLAENLADISTKGLPRLQHEHLCSKIFGTKVSRGVEGWGWRSTFFVYGTLLFIITTVFLPVIVASFLLSYHLFSPDACRFLSFYYRIFQSSLIAFSGYINTAISHLVNSKKQTTIIRLLSFT